jgi:hypothetical protein
VTLDIDGITFDETHSTPLYLQIAEIIQTGINEKRIRAGDARSSERELSLTQTSYSARSKRRATRSFRRSPPEIIALSVVCNASRIAHDRQRSETAIDPGRRRDLADRNAHISRQCLADQIHVLPLGVIVAAFLREPVGYATQ